MTATHVWLSEDDVKRNSVAVIGAGLVGTCVALELAEKGWAVDLFDRCHRALQRASLQNEGKLHLGYVYGLDSSLRTARRMLEGSAVFQRLIGRWTDDTQLLAWRSRPFIYAVPATSLLPPTGVRHHLEAVDRLAEAVDPEGLAAYRGWRQLSRDELSEQFDPRMITAAFQTGELALDVPSVVQALELALIASTVVFRRSSQVHSIRPFDDSWLLAGQQDAEPFTESYSVVVNATWEQRMTFDGPLGLGSARQVMHRYKAGLRSTSGVPCPGLPSVTFCLGSYGDTVSYPSGAYLCWYPTGLLRQETSPIPAVFSPALERQAVQQLVHSTFAGLSGFMPQRMAELDPDPDVWQLVGGWISAWGCSGIEDPSSELHQRHDIGVQSLGTYHSIDTGKWTTAPLLAAETCARIGDPP